MAFESCGKWILKFHPWGRSCICLATPNRKHRQGTDGCVRTNTASGKLREGARGSAGGGRVALVVAAVCRLTQPEMASSAACSNEPLPASGEYWTSGSPVDAGSCHVFWGVELSRFVNNSVQEYESAADKSNQPDYKQRTATFSHSCVFMVS